MTGLFARLRTSARLALASVGAVLLAVLATVAVVAAPAQAAGPRPHFQMPVPCGETWRLATYYGHEDYDIDMTYAGGSNGRAILASYGGTVTFAGWGNSGGWYVVIDHGGGWKTFYLHMIESPAVRAGQWVSTGQQLGRVGSTGNSTGPHLHYEQTRDGVKTESYFNGVPSGITSDGSPNTGPLYVAGPTSSARNLTSQNCGQVNNNRQVYESGSHNGWQMLPVNSITGSATASMVMGTNKLLYTVNDGRVYEASSDTGWRNLWTGISGVSNNALAVINVDGVKYVYTVVGGMVHEAASNNGWRNLNTGISGVSGNALAAINLDGVKHVYTVAGGMVHEAASNNGWRNLNSGISGVSASALAAINLNGVKIVYTVVGGSVHEAASNTGWRNLNTGISGVSASALAAINLNGVKIIYSVAGGMVHEAGSSTGWRNLNSGVRGTAVSAMSLSGVKILYTV
ncbi:M23 family metallopeptidase [Micromonospora peucetia]|uniref:M23 family metallopeptidase n=1 Tax=Micromonospora peucetia TaxID=47871 RepID=A0A1C6UC43_9ACTN|nr:M23 family metallopeptidase [Micromonospora peucetia]WSA33798.1 M23 family metallopeptidase [Micromonospora peucetia]SCL51538.1 Peptidase family M23 [Micromonospora peucetia]